MTMLCAGTAIHAASLTPEQITAFEQEYAPEGLSPKNEALIHSIMHELNFTQNINIKKSTPQMIEVGPIYMFENYSADVNMWIINEAWFDALTPEEQRYVVGNRLLAIEKTTAAYLDAEKALNFNLYATGIAEIVLALGLGFALYAYSHSKMKAIIASIALVGALDYLSDPFFESMKNQKVLGIIYQADDYIVQKLDCLDGALSVLKQKRDLVEPLYNKDKAYWKINYEVLAPRIAHLETLKTTKNA